jgi:RHS repeat-associated protein
MVVSAAGAIENESDYYPWGGELKITAADAGNHYKFTGKERDAESGLDYFGARYYGNAFGRFLTPDWGAYPSPIPYSDLQDPQSFNRYSYVRNAPTSSVDPDGHDCTSDKNGNVHCVVREKLPNSDPPKAGDPHKTASQEPYFQYRINRWIHRMNQRIDNALAPFYQHFQNTLDILDPCPHKEMSCGVVFPIGGIDPVLKGMAGVLRATAEIEAEGGQVVATEVTMRNSAGTARVDLVYKDADGTLKLGEAKNGPTAGLNPNQRAVYDAAAREGATFVGGNARVAGLTSIGPTAVRLFKY